ncbi:hypothetical protein HYALB_00002658 [Hymenoscyphus albidus]|uniref:BTB domain-containing protein n=1 Tax=Hymenoscyphus albidus TaxID=595503 RepID=A0A9N9LWT2_9HELO|nr:hypothetical protein HYALB_00002658 [Hymenoscyphus albidus]
MAQPPQKRARLSTTAGEDADSDRTDNENESDEDEADFPEVYRLPGGLKPDVRLLVFNREYHVHSVILKLHSNYFRKFLDSPDKSSEPASVNFQYEYVTVVDGDGIWALEPANKVKDPVFTPERLQLLENRGISISLERFNFENLISAMYNRPYELNSSWDVIDLTCIADFCCALPIVSATLSGQLVESDFIIGPVNEEHISGDSVSLIFAARKLRHKRLFHECLIHIVSQFSKIESKVRDGLDDLQKDKEIYALVLKHYMQLCKKIMKAEYEQIRFMQTTQHKWKPSPAAQQVMSPKPETNAAYYREIQKQLRAEENKHGECAKSFKLAVDDLLENQLWLGISGIEPGCGAYKRRFLSCDAEHIEYPWDEDEVDW